MWSESNNDGICARWLLFAIVGQVTFVGILLSFKIYIQDVCLEVTKASPQ